MRPLLICVLILGIAACAKPAATAPAKPPVPVVTATATLRDVPVRLSAIGLAAASELVTVRPRISAALAAVRFQEGDLVQAGAPLFALDDQAAAAGERQAAAELARAQAQLALAESESARTADLVRQNLAATQQADQARAALAVAQAAAAAATAALERSRLELAWCTISAPISGRTGSLAVTPGNLVAAQQTALVTIARLQPMHVGFAIPAGSLSALRAAQSAEALTVSAIPAGGGQAEDGSLALVDNHVDPATGTIQLRASCANTQERLWPGMSCQVEITLGLERQAVTVPATAVLTGQRGALVWVIAADGTATPRPVTTGRTVDGFTIIASGLAGGEVVVVDGQLRLSPGAAVTVPAADKAPAARGAAR